MHQNDSDPSAECHTFLAMIGLGAGSKSDQATAMLAGEILSEALQQLIGRRLRRSDLAYRIESAYDLQLVNEAERHDLRLVRAIRREFAHRLDAGFNDPGIAGQCFELTAGQGIICVTGSPRPYFVATVALLSFALTAKRMQRNGRTAL